jgi:predicted Zn-dependent protease
MTRRGVFAGLAAAAGLAGCSENADTGRNQLMLVSDEQLSGLADQSWSQVAAQFQPVADPAMQARLVRVAKPIAEAAGRPDLSWEFVVLDSPEFNAFVLPNGKVGVFHGLMTFAADDDELGSVLAHEAGHIVARHPAERVSQQLAVQAGVSIAQAMLSGENGDGGQLAGAALGMGAVYGVILPFSRKHELEADLVGVELMRKVGMDPNGAVTFWRRMIARAEQAPKPPEALSTHPADGRRLAALEAAVAAAAAG